LSQEPISYLVTVPGADNIEVIGETRIKLASGEVLTLPIRLRAKQESLSKVSVPITFKVTELGENDTLVEDVTAEAESRFMSPLKL